MIKFQRSQALTSHIESFWSIVYMLELLRLLSLYNASKRNCILYGPNDEKLCRP